MDMLTIRLSRVAKLVYKNWHYMVLFLGRLLSGNGRLDGTLPVVGGNQRAITYTGALFMLARLSIYPHYHFGKYQTMTIPLCPSIAVIHES